MVDNLPCNVGAVGSVPGQETDPTGCGATGPRFAPELVCHNWRNP